MRRKITLSIAILLSLQPFFTKAQNWLGSSFGNYSGANGVYLNPSSIAESKYTYHLNLWGHGANIYSNYLNYNAPFGIRDWAQSDPNNIYKDPVTGKIRFDQTWITEQLSDEPKQLSLYREIRMPGFMFPVGENANMSVNLRQRSSIQAFSVATPFARVMRYGIDTNGVHFNGNNALQTNTRYNTGDFSSNIENYQELSLTYAGKWLKNSNHQLDVGTTIKFVRGLGSAYLNSSGGQFEINGNDSITLHGGEYSFGHTAYDNIRQPLENDYQLLFPSAGSGLGFDFGFTYMYTPNQDKYLREFGCDENDKRNNYVFKFAAAINDIGFINYNNAVRYNRTINVNGLRITPNMVSYFNEPGIDGFDTLDQTTFEPLGFTKSSGFTSQLPTALNVSMDFRATNRFFIGVNWNQDLKRNKATGMRATSYLALLPRFEFRGFELAAPMVLGQNYKELNLGLYTKIGPFFIGSENLNGLLNKASNSSYSGADVYAGVAFGIGHCPRWVEEEFDDEIVENDTTVIQDTIIKEQIIEKDETIIKGDTVIKIIERIDTLIQTKEITKTDTLVIEKFVTTEKVTEEIDKREKEVIAREKKVQEKERLLSLRERQTNCDRCEKERLTLKNKVAALEKTITLQRARILQLEKDIVQLKKEQRTGTDTVVIDNCGPRIFKDESGKSYNKCEWNEIQLKQLQKDIEFYKKENENLKKQLAECKNQENNLDKIKIQNLEKEVQILRTQLKQKDTIFIDNCGPKIYKDESGNTFNKCEWNEIQIKQLKSRISKLEQEKKSLELKIQNCEKLRQADQIKLKELETKKAENDKIQSELEKQKQEAEKRKAEAARQAQLQAQKAQQEKAKAEAAKKAREAAAAQAAREQAAKAAAQKAAEAAKKAAEEKAREEAAKKAALEKAKKEAEEKAKKEAEEKKKKEELK